MKAFTLDCKCEAERIVVSCEVWLATINEDGSFFQTKISRPDFETLIKTNLGVSNFSINWFELNKVLQKAISKFKKSGSIEETYEIHTTNGNKFLIVEGMSLTKQLIRMINLNINANVTYKAKVGLGKYFTIQSAREVKNPDVIQATDSKGGLLEIHISNIERHEVTPAIHWVKKK